MIKINKMVYFMLAVTAFVVASFMTEPDLAATGENAGATAVTGDVLSIDTDSDDPLLTIGTEHGEIELNINDKTLKDIKEGDNVAVRYSTNDIMNVATEIKIIPSKKK